MYPAFCSGRDFALYSRRLDVAFVAKLPWWGALLPLRPRATGLGHFFNGLDPKRREMDNKMSNASEIASRSKPGVFGPGTEKNANKRFWCSAVRLGD
jgi:hypothetical protein